MQVQLRSYDRLFQSGYNDFTHVSGPFPNSPPQIPWGFQACKEGGLRVEAIAQRSRRETLGLALKLYILKGSYLMAA